jgi:hemolysin activation/secretion protein
LGGIASPGGVDIQVPVYRATPFPTLAAAVGIALGLAATAFADQPLSPYDISRVKPPQAPAPSTPLTPPPAPPVTSPEDAEARFVLGQVVFEGAKAVSQNALRPAWSGLVGESVSLSDLRVIGRRAEALYAKAGFPFVAVRLRVQQVTGGVVHYQVIEGRISELTVLGADPIARQQATAMLEPIVNKAPLPIDAVETAYQLARAVPGLSVAGTLRQGGEPGGMDLVVAAQREEPLTLYVNVNNLYADNVGPWGVLVGAEYDGRLPYGDRLSVLVYDSAPDSRQTLVHGDYSVGLDPWGTRLEASGLWGRADPVTGGADPLTLATNIASERIEISQPIVERRDISAVVDLGLESNDQQTLLSPTIPLADDRLRDFTASITSEQTGALGRWDGSIELRQGLTIFGASREHDPDLSRPDGDPQATVVKVSFEAQSAVWRKLVSVAFRSDLQYAAEPLEAPDQYAFGNLAIGRGYQPGLALADSVVAGSIEERLGPFALTKIWPGLQAQPFIFVDSGRLRDLGSAAYQLTSFGGGVRLQTAGKVEVDLVYADPLDGPPMARRPPPMVLLNMTIGLNDIYSSIHQKLAKETGK